MINNTIIMHYKILIFHHFSFIQYEFINHFS